MARPVIALLTDFGLSDHYVASMKGVILGITADVTLLDITHDIPAQDVLSGALELESVAPYLPPHTIVVAVVDPGVGSARRAVALECGGGLRCVGPDNGLLSLVAEARGVTTSVEIQNPAVRLPSVSKTFEGRDRFAPAAAWLARGIELSSLGPSASNLRGLDMPTAERAPNSIDGHVLRADRFGNLMTNIPGSWLDSWPDRADVHVGNAHVGTVTATYSDSPQGSLCALIGSSGRLEIAVNGGDAANRLGAARGARVHVRRLAPA